MNVRTAAKRRHAKRLRLAAESRFAALKPKRREIQWSVGAALAKGATSIWFPPAPEPRDWDEVNDLIARITPKASHPQELDDWEPPRVELPLKPANLGGDEES